MSSVIDTLIKQTIQNPTHEMRTAFSKLPAPHKWLLFALAEIETQLPGYFPLPDGNLEILATSFERLCPEGEDMPFDVVSSELSDGFLARKVTHLQKPQIDWIHPSCRDLTVEELARNTKFRTHFLSRCSASGVALAISIAGGAKGERWMPLLVSDRDWEILGRNCHRLQKNGENVFAEVWKIFQVAKQQSGSAKLAGSVAQLRALAVRLWKTQLKLKKHSPWRWSELEPVLAARSELSPKTPIPGVEKFWEQSMKEAQHNFKSSSTDISGIATTEFVEIATAINDAYPEIREYPRAASPYEAVISAAREKARSDAGCSISISGEDKLRSLEAEKEAYEEMAGAYRSISELPNISDEAISEFEECIREIESSAESVQEKIDEFVSEPEPEPDLEEIRQALPIDEDESSGITVERLFEDL